MWRMTTRNVHVPWSLRRLRIDSFRSVPAMDAVLIVRPQRGSSGMKFVGCVGEDDKLLLDELVERLQPFLANIK
jgi:hypothetical protein